MKMKKTTCVHFASGFVVAALWMGCGFKSEQADLIVHNGVILTLDFESQRAQAVAVRDGRVLEAGPERTILNKYSATTYTDLQGGVLMPGLMDGHAHLLGYANGLLEANLMGTESWEDAVERVQQHQESWPSEWVVGRGWDQNDWATQDFPDRQLLDVAFPDKPVALERIDGHALIVNEQALRLAGIFDPNKRNVEGGEIVRNANGLPTGVLVDNACSLVTSIIPPRPEETRLKALDEAQQNLLAAGITCVTDAGLSPQEINWIDSLQQAGRLQLRVNALVSASDENIEWLIQEGRRMKDRLMVNGVKFYMDGALGSRGALLSLPYTDRPGWHGLSTQDLASYHAQLGRLREHKLQAATHCIGDSAVAVVLDAYGDWLEGPNDARWRIEHAQVVSEADVQRFATYSVIPSVQPTHATSDMYWAGERLGRNRIRRAYAYQELLGALGMVALGTDFPVELIDPRRTFVAAVARVDATGYPTGGFQSENALSPEQALRGMTQWVALSQFQEADLGTIEPGKRADFTWVDRNWLDAEPAAVGQSQVKGTCIGGRWCFLK
jgi:hypothetical protein